MKCLKAMTIPLFARMQGFNRGVLSSLLMLVYLCNVYGY